jgi:hypothetical protein
MVTRNADSLAGTHTVMKYEDMNYREPCWHKECNAVWCQEMQTALPAHPLKCSMVTTAGSLAGTNNAVKYDDMNSQRALMAHKQ